MPVQRIAQFTTLILSALVALLAARWTWQLVALAQPAPLALPALAQTGSPLPAETRPYDLKALIDAPLFGAEAQQRSQPKALPTAAPRSAQTHLKLIGIIGGERGAAIILDGARQRTYLTGEYLAQNRSLQLAQVAANHVILLRDGVAEKLELAGERRSANIARTPATVARATTIDLQQAQFRQLLGDARSTLQNNPLQLSRFLTLLPVQQDGALQGYRLDAGQDKRLFSALGLQPGDLIKSIDGTELRSLSLPQLYSTLQSQDSFQVEILRQGSPLQFNLQF